MFTRVRRVAVGGAMTLAMFTAAVTLTGTAEATGDPAATISTGDGVLYSGCWDHAFSYAVTLPAGSTHWDLDVTAYGPDGLKAGGDYLYGSTDSPAPGTGSVYLCNSLDLGGTYTLGALFEWTDQDFVSHTTPVAPVTFTMRKPFTRTGLSASTTNPRYGQRVTLRVTSRDERPAGYFANDYATVRVQRYSVGGWANVSGGRLITNSTGNAWMRYRFASRHTVKLRAVTVGTAAYTRSSSATVYLH